MTSGVGEQAQQTPKARQVDGPGQTTSDGRSATSDGEPVAPNASNHLPGGKSGLAQESGGQAAREAEHHEQPQRPFDVIIFAASSSVGRYLVEELALVVDKYYSGEESSAAPTSTTMSSNNLQVGNQFSQQLRRRSVPSSSMSDNSIRWAVAGRSAVRLSETLCQAELCTGIRNLSNAVPVILADLNHRRSLLNMCQKTRLVINCAGPYSELGAELLIQACLWSGTHYVDLAHEATFIESMAKLYSDCAKRRGVLILNGCGFQSMSAECGINFMKQVVDGRIEQVKIILSLSDTSAVMRLGPAVGVGPSTQSAGIVSRGMWNSLLAEKSREVSVDERIRSQATATGGRPRLANSEFSISEEQEQEAGNEDPEKYSREPLLTDERATSSAAQSTGEPTHPTGKVRVLERKNTQWLVQDMVQFRNRAVSIAWPLQLIQGFQIQKGRGYCWPIDALTGDESQLIRGEMNDYELRRPDLGSSEGWRPIRTSSFFSVKNFTHLWLLFVWLFVFQVLIKFSPARYLMRKLPHLASLGHVTSQAPSRMLASGSSTRQPLDRDSLSHIKYCQTFIAYGQPSDSSGDPLEERDRHTQRRQVQLLVSRVVGPEPNHVATATFAIQAALTVLLERDHLPAKGGVLTPGAAFAETNIIYQLRRRNIKFEVLKKA